MKETKTNKELLLRIQKGDMLAFFNLYNRYNKQLYGFVLRYVKQYQDAEEIVQEVFIIIWNERLNINIDLSFEAYLFTIAYNKTISMLRKRISEQKYVNYLNSIQNPNTANDFLDELYFRELSENVKV